jgi:hypothetical protein
MILHQVQIDYSSSMAVPKGVSPRFVETRNQKLSTSNSRKQQQQHDTLSEYPTLAGDILDDHQWWNETSSHYDPITYDQLRKAALKPYLNVTTVGE